MMDKATLKRGQKVLYSGVVVIVRSVEKNGVRVEFEGMGLQTGRLIVRRVSARYLSPYSEHIGAAA